ncbi:MAG: tyrosine--tRNA ligase [Halanaerobiales bacterium]|nr:tyrosine--tRNA ligase [Halanaerobiales bacterium]
MDNVFELLMARGYIEQTTGEEEIRQQLAQGPVTFYIGFDPTADSLHLGHFIQVMVMIHLQQAGHRPIALIGGGTALVGDPSGKTEMRKMLSADEINHNAELIKQQLAKYIDFTEGKAIAVNNAQWLQGMNYINFLREVGVHFSVNRMLTAECFKSRMEKGLSFLEFNYMLMQSYDFYHLYKKYNCTMEFGGNDQWSNILGGTDLIRRKEGVTAYGLTFKLLTTSEGKKMGKTESGTIWIDPAKTPPYDLYQYLRNIDDADVENALALLTFLPMEQVKSLGSLAGSAINQGKEELAFQFTKIVHGAEEAQKAKEAAQALFSSGGELGSSTPTTEVERAKFEQGYYIVRLLKELGLASSNGEARRLIKQGGIYLNEQQLADSELDLTLDHFVDQALILRKGKKIYHRVVLK